jgi:redox-sensitive bicupin YhaK (pirin superfamily)
MTIIRTIAETFTSIPTTEGAGVHLRRAFGFNNPKRHDPFLLLDDFRSENPDEYLKGFPWHPHRGIETITYVLKGDVEHGDSLGNSGTISDGDVQWMTAGSGIIHQEMPKGDGRGAMHGFQLWLNLPASKKMCQPRYRDISSEDISLVYPGNGVLIRIICGIVDGVAGPVTGISTEAEYLDITLPADTNYSHPTLSGSTSIAYVIGGAGQFEPGEADEFGDKTLILFSNGEEITVTSGSKGVRFLMLCGKPLGEPIAWQGPIVMNTEEELHHAFEEYQNGTFLSHQQPSSG